MNWTSVWRILVVMLLVATTLFVMSLCMYGFDHQSFIGQDYLCVIMAFISIVAFVMLLFKLLTKWSNNVPVRQLDPSSDQKA